MLLTSFKLQYHPISTVKNYLTIATEIHKCLTGNIPEEKCTVIKVLLKCWEISGLTQPPNASLAEQVHILSEKVGIANLQSNCCDGTDCIHCQEVASLCCWRGS